MDAVKLKRSMRLSAVVLIITIGNLMHITQNDSVRAVVALTLVTMGFALGVLLVNLAMYNKIKRGTGAN